MRTLWATLASGENLNADFETPIVKVEHLYAWTLQVTAAGALVAGDITVQGSCDQGDDEIGTGVTNWFALDTPVALTAAGTIGINFDGQGCKWVRVRFEEDSGTGTYSILFHGKGA